MIDDPLLRKIIEDALKGGNTSLRDDLNPQSQIIKRPMPWDAPDRGPDAMLRQNPMQPIQPHAMPQGFLASLRDRVLSGGPLPYNTDLRRGDRNYASRNALRMFVQGLNANPRMVGEHGEYGIRGAVAGRNAGGASGGITPYQQASLGMRREDLDLRKSNTETDNTRADKQLAALEEWRKKIDEDRDLSRADREFFQQQLDAYRKILTSQRQQGITISLGNLAERKKAGARAGSGSNRAQLSARFNAKAKEMTGRVAAIGATNGWSPEEIKAAQDRQIARLSDEYSALLTGDDEVQETPAWQDAGRPAAQRYTKPVAKGKKSDPAGIR